ncbi:restriction endonuclease subunit S [Luteibacter yeojuensis]
MLPEGWQRIRLENIADVRTGLAKGKTGLRDPVELPYLRVANVQDGHLNLAEIKTIWIERDQIDRYRLRWGDVLMTEGGDFDKLGRGDVWREQIPLCLHQNHVFVVRPDQGRLNPWFLAALAASEHGRNYFLSCAKRSTNLASINATQLKAFPVLLPCLEEQRGIAAALAVWDAAIATTDRLLVNSWQHRQALLGKLLQVPVLSSPVRERERAGSIPPSVQPGVPRLSATPKGWRRTKLGKHLREVARPVALQSDQRYDLVTVKRSRGGVVLRDKLLGNEIRTPSQFQVKAGDFLISKRQIVHGACGIVPPELDGAIVSNEYSVLISDGGIDLNFLRYLSESIYFQQTCFHSSIGVHVEKMIFNTERWLAFPFNIPPLNLQLDIVDALDAASATMECCAKQTQSLRQEKASLMQQLLTGKRRVRLPASPEALSV